MGGWEDGEIQFNSIGLGWMSEWTMNGMGEWD